jgi:hypothetical protein
MLSFEEQLNERLNRLENSSVDDITRLTQLLCESIVIK